MLYPNAMCLGFLAQPPTAEQMEALLDGLLTPEERVIRGPDGMEPLAWLKEAKPDVLFLDAAHGGMELGMDVPPLERILPANFVRYHNSTTDKIHTLERTAAILTDGSRVPVSQWKYEKVQSQCIASMRLCMQ